MAVKPGYRQLSCRRPALCCHCNIFCVLVYRRSPGCRKMLLGFCQRCADVSDSFAVSPAAVVPTPMAADRFSQQPSPTPAMVCIFSALSSTAHCRKDVARFSVGASIASNGCSEVIGSCRAGACNGFLCWPQLCRRQPGLLQGCSQVPAAVVPTPATVARLSAAVVPTPVMASVLASALALTPLAAARDVARFSAAVVPTPVTAVARFVPTPANGCSSSRHYRADVAMTPCWPQLCPSTAHCCKG
jgi:hypothetical protein